MSWAVGEIASGMAAASEELIDMDAVGRARK